MDGRRRRHPRVPRVRDATFRRPYRYEVETGPLQILGLFQSRQWDGRDPWCVLTGQRGGGSDFSELDAALQESWNDYIDDPQYRRNRSSVVRCGRPSWISVYPGPDRI